MKTAGALQAATVEREIDGFLARYTPALQAQLRQARAVLQRRVARGHEMVYDNYNALVFGYGPTLRVGDAVLSIAGYPRWVTLFFLHGAALADAKRLLQGHGRSVRHIRLAPIGRLDDDAVRALIDSALAAAEGAFEAAPPLTTVVKSISARQRPRRPG